MKTSFISTLSVQSSMRATINQVQNDLIKSQKEVVSGRYGNLGEVLGATTSRSLNLHRDLDQMANLMATNSVVTQRLSSTQMAMETISNAGQTALNTLVALAGSTDMTQLRTATQTLTDVVDQFIDASNTSVNGEYVLAGINTDVTPVSDYKNDENGTRTAFREMFVDRFGFEPNDAQAVGITPADMQDFITNFVEPMFFDESSAYYVWTSQDPSDPDVPFWSTASDTPVTSRISRTEVVQTAATANADGFRYLAMASVIGIEMLSTPLTSDARAVLGDNAIAFLGKAINGIDEQRSLLGLSENRVTIANEMLQAQVDIVKLNLDDLEGVDVYEASTRITALTNQMEISYNLTARLSQLSLVNQL